MNALKKFITTHIYTVQPIQWLFNTRTLLRLIGSFNRSTEHQTEEPQRFAILVLPWVGTDVPWFSIVFGLFLSRKGNDVVFVVDDLPFGNNPVRFKFILSCINSVLKQISKRYPVIRLSAYSPEVPLSTREAAVVSRLAAFNAVWALKGETSGPGRKRYIEIITRQLGTIYAAVKDLIARNAFEVLFIPGGVYSSSGIWEECAKGAGVRVSSYDGGAHGVLLLCANGIAAQLQDIPRAFSILKSRADFGQEKGSISAAAMAEMRRRRAGKDKFSSQISGENNLNLKFNNGVLIALNSSWDSAALGLHVVFENSAQWIVNTTRWLLDSTDSDIIIRQHPVERLDIARTTDDYRRLLADNFADNPRVHFIPADAHVNTYDLLNAVAVVAVYTSTIGTEAAAIGKVVVTPSKSYYSSLGFVWNADTKEKYFNHLSSAVKGKYSVSAAMKDDALCCYYLTQCCNWVPTPFNPGDFADWSKYSLNDLYMLSPVQISLDSIQNNMPVAVLNHLASFGNKEIIRGERI